MVSDPFQQNIAHIVQSLSKWAYAAATATAVVFEASAQSRRKVQKFRGNKKSKFF